MEPIKQKSKCKDDSVKANQFLSNHTNFLVESMVLNRLEAQEGRYDQTMYREHTFSQGHRKAFFQIRFSLKFILEIFKHCLPNNISSDFFFKHAVLNTKTKRSFFKFKVKNLYITTLLIT